MQSCRDEAGAQQFFQRVLAAGSVKKSIATTHTAASAGAGMISAPRQWQIVALFALALLPLLIPPFVPTIDFYDHVARYYVLAHLDGDAFLAQNYAPRWAILPNIGMDILGATLAHFLPTAILAKFIIGIIFAVQFFGLLYFNHKLTGTRPLIVALLGVSLLYSFIFTWGFANFLLGLGLSLWGAGWWIAHRDRPWVAVPTTCVIAVVVFLTHGFAFGLFGLLLGGLEIGYFLADRTRSVRGLALRMASLALLAVIPAILFRASATVKASEGVTNADESVRRLVEQGGLLSRLQDVAVHRLATVLRVSEGPNLGFDLASNATLAGVVALLLVSGRLRFAAPTLPALAIGAMLFAIVPPALFGVGYVGDRIPLLLALVATAALYRATFDQPDRLERSATVIVAAVVAMKVGAVSVAWLSYRAEADDYRAVLAQIPPQSLVAYSNFANTDRLSPKHRCEMYGPLLATNGHGTPLFVIPTAQPMELIGPLKTAVASKPSGQQGHASLGRSMHRFESIARAGSFDYILACEATEAGVKSAAGRVLVASRGRFQLYKLEPETSD